MQMTGRVCPLDGLHGRGDGHRPTSTGIDGHGKVACTAYGAPREGETRRCTLATSVDRVRGHVL